MQLRKQNWKRFRNQTPCVKCGQDHVSSQCVTRNGARRVLPEVTHFIRPMGFAVGW
jgi:hypothetical protein